MALSSRFDVVVLGAGAAGMMCAFEAGRRGRSVLLLDHADRPGRKILISGGGRCNFTNTDTRPENFLTENAHFARSALARFTPADMVALVEQHGIPYHEKKLGQLFCDVSARQIVTLLERECGAAGVDLRCGVRVLSVHRNHEPLRGSNAARFSVNTTTGDFTCHDVVVATGGLSIPKMGATGFGYELARQFGHRVVETRPALVPLVLGGDDLAHWGDLAGVSTEVTASVLPGKDATGSPGPRRRPTPPVLFRENLLLTHRGLSGPAVLQVSSYWQPGAGVSFDLAPDASVFRNMRAHSGGRDARTLLGAVKRVLPARMAERWVELWLRRPADWTNAGLEAAEAALHNWRPQPAGNEGFAKAEVTVGGVSSAELHPQTMESRLEPGLYFIGEVVDVTGWLGGYNFQWAWASAAACGRSFG